MALGKLQESLLAIRRSAIVPQQENQMIVLIVVPAEAHISDVSDACA